MGIDLPDAFWSLTASEILARLHTSREGLPEEEVRQRLDLFGHNTLKVRKHTGVLRLLLSQYKSPIILLLLFACLLSVALHDHVDALIILAILLVSGLLGFWQEYGASNALGKLLAIVQIKGGKAQCIPPSATAQYQLKECLCPIIYDATYSYT